MKRTVKLISLVALISLLSACFLGFTACNGSGERELDTVVIGTTASIEKAVRGEYNYDMLASGNSELPLVCQGEDGTFHPLLADCYTEDSKTWVFTVKDGMKWSDGEAVTAEDILFTLNYSDEFENTNYFKGDKKYESASVSEDKRSISLSLVSANVRELSNMTGFRVMPKHVYEGKAPSEITEAEARVVCGPFVLNEFNRQAGTLTYVRNQYYPKTPNVKKLVYKLFSNADTMYMALGSGDVDMVWIYSAGVAKTYFDVLKTNDKVTLKSSPAGNVPAVLMFNNDRGIFSDGNIRRAVSYALDYDAFKTLFGSELSKVPNRGFAPEGTIGYKATERLEKNFEKAEAELLKSGYSAKNSAGFYEKGGKELGFALTVNASNATHLRYAELVKNNLESFGIRVTLDALDTNSFRVKTSKKFAGAGGITMEAAINGFTAAGMGMGAGLGSIYVDKNHSVQGGCQVDDGEFVSILNEMNYASSIDEYCAAAGKLQDYYSSAVPLIALFGDNIIYAHSSALSGFVVDYTFGLNNVNTWFSLKRGEAR